MSLLIYLKLQKALAARVVYLTTRRDKARADKRGYWENELQDMDTVLRWFDAQQPTDILPVDPSVLLGNVIEAHFPGVTR
jgi:hypothetical protein